MTRKERKSDCSQPLYAKQWSFSPEYGNEKLAMQFAAETIREQLCQSRLEDVLTVLAEACINAIEYGDGSSPIIVRMNRYSDRIEFDVINASAEQPLLPLAITATEIWEQQTPRGWGLLLIRQLTDQFHFGHCREGFFVKMTYFVEVKTV